MVREPWFLVRGASQSFRKKARVYRKLESRAKDQTIGRMLYDSDKKGVGRDMQKGDQYDRKVQSLTDYMGRRLEHRKKRGQGKKADEMEPKVRGYDGSLTHGKSYPRIKHVSMGA